MPDHEPPVQESHRPGIAVLISGTGTTLRNLIRVEGEGGLVPAIRLVISSNPAAAGLQFAQGANIPVAIVDWRDYRDPVSFSAAIFDCCRQWRVAWVVLGGFLKRLVIPPDFAGRVINIHPSLIPAFCGEGFYGIRVHQAVIDAGCAETGCTVHFVDDEYDHGPIIAQRRVPVIAGDTASALAARVFRAECELYPQVINHLVRDAAKGNTANFS